MKKAVAPNSFHVYSVNTWQERQKEYSWYKKVMYTGRYFQVFSWVIPLLDQLFK